MKLKLKLLAALGVATTIITFSYGCSKNTTPENTQIQKRKQIKGFAQRFGTKPFEEIQRMPSVYKVTDLGNGEIQVGWHPENMPLLIRVDNTTQNITKVYQYDKNKSDRRGKLLYTGRTIYQKNKRPVVYE